MRLYNIRCAFALRLPKPRIHIRLRPILHIDVIHLLGICATILIYLILRQKRFRKMKLWSVLEGLVTLVRLWHPELLLFASVHSRFDGLDQITYVVHVVSIFLGI